MHEWTSWWWPMGGLFWIILLVLVAYGAFVYFPRGPLNDLSSPFGGSTALRTLDERYAKGEIDRDEYLQRKRDILGRGEA